MVGPLNLHRRPQEAPGSWLQLVTELAVAAIWGAGSGWGISLLSSPAPVPCNSPFQIKEKKSFFKKLLA